MNNETTASQPKSIGDDAQFVALLDWCLEAHISGVSLNDRKRFDAGIEEFIAYIDSRAPAAQASATIQAAPDIRNAALEEAAEKCKDLYSWRGAFSAGKMCSRTSDVCSAAILSLKSSSAATIQEPVMVAEPVGALKTWPKEIYLMAGDNGALCNFDEYTDPAWYGQRVSESDVKYVRADLAAPMVADPAGVAEIGALLDRHARAWSISNSNDHDSTTERLAAREAILAATVKAVPSEALSMGQVLDFLHPDFVTGCAAKILRNGDMVSFNLFQLANIANRVRAPLAGKAGGGE